MPNAVQIGEESMPTDVVSQHAEKSARGPELDLPSGVTSDGCPVHDRPPMPLAREGRISIWRYFELFRRDILSAQPAHLFRAWMAEFRTPFFRSYMCNDPELVDRVLKAPIRVFSKSERIRVGLKPLLGESIFISNGDLWEHQRRRHVFPAM